MKINRLHLVYFSPAGSTKRVLQKTAEAFSLQPREFDVTDVGSSLPAFSPDDFLLIGVPVYSGRVPKTALERFESLCGANTPAAVIVTYGNRDYDDALLELKNTVEANGCKVIAAGAFISEHCIAPTIGTGRPNESDLAAIADFGARIVNKLDSIETLDGVTLAVKGNENYREYKPLPICPRGDSSCTNCGECVKHCPAQAIEPAAPRKTNKDKCICCMRCVKLCPRHARKLLKAELWAAEKLILGKCSGDKQPEIFI